MLRETELSLPHKKVHPTPSKLSVNEFALNNDRSVKNFYATAVRFRERERERIIVSTSEGKLLENRHRNHSVATRETSNSKASK